MGNHIFGHTVDDSGSDSETDAAFTKKDVRVCVVRFQDFSQETHFRRLGESFNDTLTLPFQPIRDDFSPAALMRMEDKIHFTVYDEVEPDGGGSDEDSDSEEAGRSRKKKADRVFLGSYTLPFSVVYMSGGIDKTWVRLHTPLVSLGYALPSAIKKGRSAARNSSSARTPPATQSSNGDEGGEGSFLSIQVHFKLKGGVRWVVNVGERPAHRLSVP